MNKDKIPAAMYIRMSTEHQKYSPENQAAAIREYAECNNYEIIKTYTDGGKSGLNIAGRAALQQMLKAIRLNIKPFWFWTLPAGDGFRMPMRVHITSTSAKEPERR